MTKILPDSEKRPYVTPWEIQVWFCLFLESDTMKECPDKASWNLANLQSDTISPLHYTRLHLLGKTIYAEALKL